MKKLTFALLFSLCAIWAQSQTTPKFQWVTGGGSWGEPTSVGLDESCHWIGTDARGNIYGMSVLSSDSIKIDTSYRRHGFGNDDFAVFSYRCDGSMRWVRYFGSFFEDTPYGMCTDKYGNNFIAGGVNPYLYMGTHYGDSIFPVGTANMFPLFLAKIDSNGHTVWLSFGPNASPNSNWYFFTSVQFDNQGNLCVFAKCNGLLNWGSFTIPGKGFYVLKFDKNNGNLLGFTKLDYTEVTWHDPYAMKLVIDNDGSYYMSDQLSNPDSLIIGGNLIINVNDSVYMSFLTKFLPSGNVAWYKEIDANYYNGQAKQLWGTPALSENYVYMIGATQNNVSFYGTIVSNPFSVYGTIPIIARFRKDNGNFVSLNHAYNHDLANFSALSMTSEGILVGGIAGCGTSGQEIMMYNPTDTLKPIITYGGAYPFVLGIDTALNNFNWGLATTSAIGTAIETFTEDLAGNVYAGGRFSESLFDSFGNNITYMGGNTDFFIAKLADQNICHCIKSQPYPQLVGINSHIVTVKGTATGVADSLYWIWGDGTKTKYLTQNTNVTHTYGTGGNYTVCLRSYNYCGTKDSCFAIISVGIKEQELKYLNAYPNPVSNSLTIENPYQCSMQLNIYSITGKLLFSNKYENYTSTIDMSSYEKGVYFVEIILADGRKGMRKIVRE